MSNNSQKTNQDRFGSEDGVLPGLGIVAGFLVGLVLWKFLDGWITLGPAGLWLAEGCFIAVCILISSVIDGLARPKAWSWRNRIRTTTVSAVVIVTWWGSAAIGYALAGDKADSVGWLLAFLVLFVISWLLRKRPSHHEVRQE